jgi:putative intracellular protease/amidase
MTNADNGKPVTTVAVLLYPGCIFFEIALAVDVLAGHARVHYYTPDGRTHNASNGARLAVDGDFDVLRTTRPAAVLVPGGDPRSILLPVPRANAALKALADDGALIAGICAGNLVMAAAGLLRGRRGTHNYTAEHAPPESVQATAPYWSGMIFERANLVHDGNIITAQPWAYRSYAATVARALGAMDALAAEQIEHYVQIRSYRSSV